MVKISSFIIGLIAASLIVTSMVWLMGDLSQNYNGNYTEEDFAVYNQIQTINVEATKIKNQSEAGYEQDGALDVIGSYFRQGYQALKVTSGSVKVFENMTDQAITKDANIGGERAGLIKTALITIVLILIFIGVFISAIVKKDL